MATLIKNKRIAIDSWLQLKAEFAIPASGDVIVPLAVWTAQREQLVKRAGRHGVLLENTDDPRVLTADFDRLGLIAVRFPKFVDGRGYSIARLLRRLGWKGELRAVGDVLRDQLFYMTRCGFDAFALRDDQDPQVALTAFGDFSAPYQPAIDDGVRLGTPGTTRVGGALAQLAVNPW
jgi:uncharacterized protein (DUF934 family)